MTSTQKIDLFTEIINIISKEELTVLTAATRKRKFAPKELICFNTVDSDQTYFILSGKAKIFRATRDKIRAERLAELAIEGDMMGTAGLMSATQSFERIVAHTPCSVAMIGNEPLREILLEHPALSLSFAAIFARRAAHAERIAEAAMYSPVVRRTAWAIIDLAARVGKKIPNTSEILVAHELTQGEVADLIGAARESVNKTLAEFQNRGFITVISKALILKDPDTFREMFE